MAVETQFGAADQPAAVVDEPHDAQRRGAIAARVPDIETLQNLDRRMQERRGAIVAIRNAAGDERRSRAGSCDRNGGGQPGRTTADDGDVKVPGVCRRVHAGRLLPPRCHKGGYRS